MASGEERDLTQRPRLRDDRDSPFLTEDFLAEVPGRDWEERLARLPGENLFERAFEAKPSTTVDSNQENTYEEDEDYWDEGISCAEELYSPFGEEGKRELEFDQILGRIRQELTLRFKGPDDPKLMERRQRLRLLFAAVPQLRTKELHELLGESPTTEKLSRLFHGRLAAVTRRELLRILEKRFPANKNQPPNDRQATIQESPCRREDGSITTLLPWERTLLAIANNRKEADFDGVTILVGFVPIQGITTMFHQMLVPLALKGGYAITIENSIWFPRQIDTRNVEDLKWLAHESVHVLEYATGGAEAFLQTYVWEAIKVGFKHDKIPHERRANRIEGALVGLLARFPGLATVIRSCDESAILEELQRRRNAYQTAMRELVSRQGGGQDPSEEYSDSEPENSNSSNSQPENIRQASPQREAELPDGTEELDAESRFDECTEGEGFPEQPDGSTPPNSEILTRIAQGEIGIDGLSSYEANSLLDYQGVFRPEPSRVNDAIGQSILRLLWEPIPAGDEAAIRSRLASLERVFRGISDDDASAMLHRLLPGGDLNKDFTYRLATATRARIIAELQGRVRSGLNAEPSKPTSRPQPTAEGRPAGIVRVPIAIVSGKAGSTDARQELLTYGSYIDRIVAKMQVDKIWWYEIEYSDRTKKGWVVGENIAEIAWPEGFTFRTPGSSSPFEELRSAVVGTPIEKKVARLINMLNVQILPMDDFTLGQFCAEAFYHALISANGNFKNACLIVTAAVRAFKPDTRGSFRWVQQPGADTKKFNYALYADKVWHFFWNAYRRLDGTSAWKLRQLGLLYELKSRKNPIKGFFTFKKLDEDAKADIAFNLAGIGLAEWLNKNHSAVTQHHAAVIRDNFLQAAVSMKLAGHRRDAAIQGMMKTRAVEVELQKRSFGDFKVTIEKHIDAALDAIERMGN